MANRCAGLDPTLAHLPAPAPTHCGHSTPASWLFPAAAAAAFENEALTCVLRASMSPANAYAASSSSYPTTPSSSSTSSASAELLSGGGSASPAPPARTTTVGPKAGRVTKRKPRPSRRPPPTYIMADPANFRRMVQEVTGFPAAASSAVIRMQAASSEPASVAAPRCSTPTPACLLPTLDTSAFLLDREAAAPARALPEDKSFSGGASLAMAATSAAVEEEEEDSPVFQELDVMACVPAFLSDDFPTLESWGII